MANSSSRIRVAIVGGGICGLTLAIYLNKLDKVDLRLYEGAAEFTEIGAGIAFGSNALKVYQKLGLRDAYMKLAAHSSGQVSDTFFEARFGDARYEEGIVYVIRAPEGMAAAHRAHALDLIVQKMPRDRVSFRKHLVDYQRMPSGCIQLRFADGSTADADVLIGADGIKSTVRRVMFDHKDHVEPKWTGVVAYRGLVPADKMVDIVGDHITTSPTMWLGRGRHIVQMPVAYGKLINLVCFVADYSRGRNPEWTKGAWVEQNVPKDEMMHDFQDWRTEVQKVLQLIEKPSRWAIFELPKLPYFAHGNVALMGDAAHAMSPHQGNGASQGIEDAHILAELLSLPEVTAENTSLALEAYNQARLERAQRVQDTSYDAGKVWDLVSPGDDLEKLREDATTRHLWIWNVDIDEELRKAKEILENRKFKWQRILSCARFAVALAEPLIAKCPIPTVRPAHLPNNLTWIDPLMFKRRKRRSG